jgi:hypothetical protein
MNDLDFWGERPKSGPTDQLNNLTH